LGARQSRSEQVNCATQVFEHERKKQDLARLARMRHASESFFKGLGMADGLLENFRVRHRSVYREVAHVARQCAAVQQGARDVVEPGVLAEIVE